MRAPRMTTRRWMIVVAATAVLTTAVLLVLGGQEAQARAECRHNLLAIGLALHNYHDIYDTFPPGTVVNGDLTPQRRLSWLTVLINLLTQGLQLLIEMTKPWDSPENRMPTFLHTSTDGDPPPFTTPAADVSFLRCPAHPGRPTPNGLGETDYIGVAGLGTDAATLPSGHPRSGVFSYERPTRLGDIKDGIASTMMMAETTQARGPWTAGGPATVRGLDPSRQPYIGRGRQFGGAHQGGVMVAFADGSVRFLREAIDPKVFEALSTVAGGEMLPPGWDD